MGKKPEGYFTVEEWNAKPEQQIAFRQQEINSLKHYLHETDYKEWRFLASDATAEEFEPYKKKRQEARNRINELEEEIKALRNA